MISNWTRKTVWLLINNTNMKKCARKKCRKMFLEAFFRIRENFFQSFHTKFLSLLYWHKIIGVQNFSLSFCKSKFRIAMCNLHWCYTFCTDVTLFALVLHLNCTALSQSESSNFFMYIISWVIKTPCLFYFRSVKFSYVKKHSWCW